MSQDLEKWNRLTRVLIWVTGVAAAVVVLLIFMPLFMQAEHLRRQNFELQHQIEEIRASNDKIAAQILALQNDPRAVEKEARETLGLAKPHETIYRFQENNDAKAPKH